MRAGIKFSCFSKRGRHGGPNQDYMSAYVPRNPVILSQKGVAFAVADGVRGGPGGEVASRLAVRSVLSAYYAFPWPEPIRGLQTAVALANSQLLYWAKLRPHLQGMSTTLTVAVVRGSELNIAHVGNSRAYLVRSGQAWQLTRDHTWVASALAQGLLTPQEAAIHPWKHLLIRSLGKQSVTVDLSRVTYMSGDRLVLCSDGVSDFLAPHEIGQLAMYPVHRAARALVETAWLRGGRDDASAMVVSLGQPARWSRQTAIGPQISTMVLGLISGILFLSNILAK